VRSHMDSVLPVRPQDLGYERLCPPSRLAPWREQEEAVPSLASDLSPRSYLPQGWETQ